MRDLSIISEATDDTKDATRSCLSPQGLGLSNRAMLGANSASMPCWLACGHKITV